MSSQGQRERRAAFQAQRRTIAAACRRRGWQLLEPAEDARPSAQDRGSERAQPVRERAEAQALVATTRDWPAQTLLDLANLLARAHKHGWALVDLETTLTGKETINLRASFAPCEHHLISQRIRAGLARVQGVRLGRPPTISPYVLERIRHERAAAAPAFGTASSQGQAVDKDTRSQTISWHRLTRVAVPAKCDAARPR